MAQFINSSNRLGLNYREEASKFNDLKFPIVDVHSHINGERASLIYQDAAHLYGITKVFSMTQLEQIEVVREKLGDMINFIAIPNFQGTDRIHEVTKGYAERVKKFHAFGAKIAKFWNAPRIYDASPEPFATSPFRLNNPARLEVVQLAVDLGMNLMVHVSDPDTWFATKYKDSKKYGTKKEQYEPLEEVLDRFNVPLIAAHMGGSPEDLNFLCQLLSRHSNLYLDASATKWVVREMSKHSREDVLAFMTKWQGRILFGSDIVTTDMHLSTGGENEMAVKAATESEAFDLYASRYWALRTLWESNYEGESPIVDPDLKMVDPVRYGDNDAPKLKGFNLPENILKAFYSTAAAVLK